MNSRLVISLSFNALLLSSFGLLVSESAPDTTGNETDRLSLLAFKDDISEDPFHVFSTWNTSIHFCGWSGVTCGRRHRQRVVALNLTAIDLAGSLSPSIANLTFLRSIDLSRNKLSGTIPPQLGRLFRLRLLKLNHNYLGGEIPDSLSNCSELEKLDLKSNVRIQGRIPPGFGSLSKLYFFRFSFNNLTGAIPPSLANLSSLIQLSFSNNSIGGSIPDEFGHLQKLAVLEIGDNRLSGPIPQSFFNLSSLKALDMSGNRMEGGLPQSLGLNFPGLQILYMSRNRFTGSLPLSLSNASSLREIDLGFNHFTGLVPMNLGSLANLGFLSVGSNQLGSRGGEHNDFEFLTSLTNCTGLEVISLGVNQQRGVLPASIANFSNQLTQFWLGGNEVSGTIPAGIENLVGLAALELRVNHLTGGIPPGIGKLKNLQLLDLSVNKLSGEIPSSIGNITGLNRLYLSESNLQGSLPSSLGNFRRMEELDLSGNSLTGSISNAVSISSLSFMLDLSHNHFTGLLPSEVGRMVNLRRLVLFENQLSGEIPGTLGSCISLVQLYLNGNSFQGMIPLSLSNLRGLEAIDLSQNNLSGHVPEYLGNFFSLQYLNLSFNNLEGELPVTGIFQNGGGIISLTGNKNLCGGPPKLRLPKCLNQTSAKHEKSIDRRVIIPVAIASLLLLLFLCSFAVLCWRRNPRKKSPSMPALLRHHWRVSYAELHTATNGFSTENLIGVGNYGSVYKGILARNGIAVAVKVLDLLKEGASKSFEAECNALRSIRHRNLAKILTACCSIDFRGNDFKALVYEYMQNGSLEKWLHSGVDGQQQQQQQIVRDLKLTERLRIAIEVASALEYLHGHGQEPIVHRDLKPSNVLLDEDMTAHVADFGLAKFLLRISNNNATGSQTSSAMIKGSIGYIAPEYGLGGMASVQGDAYSYGILLLELFTGKRPTDEMFNDSLSLHQYASKAMPDQVIQIADPRLFPSNEEENSNAMSIRIKECLASIIKVGIECSLESPRERMNMRNVVREMKASQDTLAKLERDGERRNSDRHSNREA